MEAFRHKSTWVLRASLEVPTGSSMEQIGHWSWEANCKEAADEEAGLIKRAGFAAS